MTQKRSPDCCHVTDRSTLEWFSKNPADYAEAFTWAALIAALYAFLENAGFHIGEFEASGVPTASVSFLVGLTAGFSTCMALVGGLVLGLSARWNRENAAESAWKRFEPHAFFGVWRLLGFALFGGLLGMAGSLFRLGTLSLGAVTLAVGVVMVLLAFGLTDLSPRLGSYSPSVPNRLGKWIGHSDATRIGAFATGALSFFIPCGFTLAMQMVAMNTGSFLSGSLTMAAFALGTAPGLLGIGWLSGIFRGEGAKRFFRFTGVLLFALGTYGIWNGYSLIRLGTPITTSDAASLEVQEIRIVQSASGYSPNVIKVKPNRKIRLIVEGRNPFSCSSQLVIPDAGVSKSLEAGENVVEFVSPASGEMDFSCSMGMYPGKIVVEP